jgi:hypothetical protein
MQMALHSKENTEMISHMAMEFTSGRRKRSMKGNGRKGSFKERVRKLTLMVLFMKATGKKEDLKDTGNLIIHLLE